MASHPLLWLAVSAVEALSTPVLPLELGDSTAHICATCGVQYEPAKEPPGACKICVDDRQYVKKSGQKWTTQRQMVAGGMRNAFQLVEPDLLGIGTVPKFGIGQRALLVQTAEGNLLWDCITLLDPATVAIIRALGGLRAIAISHPHYYSTCIEWSKAFDNCPIHIHAWDQEWLTWPHENVQLWQGEKLVLWDGLQLIQLGGHFAGAQVLLWPRGAGGKGALCTGDILQVGMDMSTVSVMRSFPNFIPLSAAAVRRIASKLELIQFDRVHGAFWDMCIEDAGKVKVTYSLQRYLDWLEADDVRA